jgi:hypothetical protein
MLANSLSAPFPWFGGKRKVAAEVWSRFGTVANYVEPFFGSGAVMLGRPAPVVGNETINDLDGYVCLAPATRLLTADLQWSEAGAVAVGDRLLGFDEENPGMARGGLRAPTAYRRWRHSTVTAVRRVVKPSWRLTFDDGTVVVASEDHLWLIGSHRSGGRGWRWGATRDLVANRDTQCSWVLKVAPVVEVEQSRDAGWLAGFFDGEGHLTCNGSGWHLGASQNEGTVLARALGLLRERGFDVSVSDREKCRVLRINGGRSETLRFLMLARPNRLIEHLDKKIAAGGVSLYARDHHAVGLIAKEFLGDRDVVAIETDTHTFIAEGLASHNCNFWRSVKLSPKATAEYADNPVNENDLHARHVWLLQRRETLQSHLDGDPEWHDPQIAGWWVWGIACWIGSGFCSGNGPWWINEAGQLVHLGDNGDNGRGVNRKLVHLGDNGDNGDNGPGVKRQRVHLGKQQGVNRKLVHLGDNGRGVNRQLVHLGDNGQGEPQARLGPWFAALAARLRNVRVCSGDWSRICGPSVTFKQGLTGVFLDPPYADTAERTSDLYREDSEDVAHAVRDWAVANGDNPLLRIALCGYEGEHEMPPSWSVHSWSAGDGYGGQAQVEERSGNGKRERIWFSPACLAKRQGSLFDRE